MNDIKLFLVAFIANLVENILLLSYNKIAITSNTIKGAVIFAFLVVIVVEFIKKEWGIKI